MIIIIIIGNMCDQCERTLLVLSKSKQIQSQLSIFSQEECIVKVCFCDFVNLSSNIFTKGFVLSH